MNVPLLDLKAQYATIREEVRAAVERVFESQHFIMGPEVTGLEAEVAEYCHCSHAVGVSSGSDALLVALMASGVKPGDEVILPTYTFFATAGAVWRLGAKPVFVDVLPDTYNIDPQAIEASLTARTKAIIPVHLYGQVADIDAVLEVAGKHGLRVIEDAAQAIGSESKGRRAGSWGDFGCFSFFPSKNLGGAGDGGMVTTCNDELADRVRLLRNHGYRPKYYNKVVGGNFRLDALQAAVLRVKLRHLDRWTEQRQHNANRYRELLAAANLPQVKTPRDSAEGRHIYNQFVIRVPAEQRNALREFLSGSGVGTEIYYPVPLHLQECFSSLGHRRGDFPVAEAAADETIALPIYPELSDAQLQQVVAAIASFVEQTGLRIAA